MPSSGSRRRGRKGILHTWRTQGIEGIIGCPVSDKFDLMYGTSTGAIIAALLGLGKSVKDVEALYRAHVVKVMSHWLPHRKSSALEELAGTVKARWVCEQAHQQLNEELGLDHFEGRSWTGLHRHALMTMIAFAFLQSRRLKQVRGGKKKRRAAATKPSRRQAGNPRRPRSPASASAEMSALQA